MNFYVFDVSGEQVSVIATSEDEALTIVGAAHPDEQINLVSSDAK